jgi:hypothetical protein
MLRPPSTRYEMSYELMIVDSGPVLGGRRRAKEDADRGPNCGEDGSLRKCGAGARNRDHIL